VAAIAVAVPVAAAATPTSHLAASLITGPHRGIGEMRGRHERITRPFGNLAVDSDARADAAHSRTVSGTRVTDNGSRAHEAGTVDRAKRVRHRRRHTTVEAAAPVRGILSAAR
jgi:hypothetical protein